MSRLQDVAALVFASPAVQDLTRSYTPVHLAEQAVKAAVAIRKSKADPHLVAMIFGAQSGSTLASLGESQIQAAVEQAAKAVELIETAAEIAEAEEAMKMADVDPAVTGGHELPNALVNKDMGNKTSESPKELTPEVLAKAIADLPIATAYKKALVAGGMNTVAEVLKYDADNASEGGLEKAKDIGKVARERILEAIKSL